MSCVRGIQLKVTSFSLYLPMAAAPLTLAIKLPWVSITPFGSLVEPEENWMKARSSGAGRCSLPGFEMSVMEPTRKARDFSSLNVSVSPTWAARASRRSRFLASV